MITPGDVGTAEGVGLTTPGDDTDPPGPAQHPTKGRRYRLFDDGMGDYRIYCIANAELVTRGLAPGSLLPIPEVPGFETTADAMKYIRNSGNQFQGMQLMVLRGMEIVEVKVESNPRVTINAKPKQQVSGPE